jgi:hypothetical protein
MGCMAVNYLKCHCPLLSIGQNRIHKMNNKIKRPVRGNYKLTFDYAGHVQWQKDHPNIEYHAGDDFYSDDRNIYACDSGIVDRIGYDPAGYGNYIKLLHAAWGYSLSCHLLTLPTFPIGFEIVQGLVIGTMGYSGNVRPPGPDGTHTHFEVRDLKNVVFNPEPWYEDSTVQGDIIQTPVAGNARKAKVVCDMAQVRKTPGFSGIVIGQVHNGNILNLTGNTENSGGLRWKEFKYTTTAWVAEVDGFGNQLIEDE